MAIVKNNILINGLSGALGPLVAKAYKDKTVIANKPKPARFPRSPEQQQNSQLFLKAVAYAAREMNKPELVPIIRKKGWNAIRLGLISGYMRKHKVDKPRQVKVKTFSPEQLAAMGCNERQQKAMAYLRTKKTLSNAIYQQINNTSKATATRDLQTLICLKLIRSTGRKGAGANYTLCL